MGTYIHDWVSLLRSTDTVVALPLAVGGLVLVLSGWRFWKLAVVLSYGCLGALAGTMIGRGHDQQTLYAVVGFLVFGAVSLPPVNYSVAVLGGILGAGLVHAWADSTGLAGSVLWILTAIGLVCGTALSFLNLRQVVMIITSFLGSLLLLSAAIAALGNAPSTFNYFYSMALESAIFLPFVMLVPTVVGTFLQAADANRKDFALAPTAG